MNFFKMEKNKSISSIKKIIKDAHYYALAKLILGFLGFLAVVIYTRLLNPKEYGLYILAITAISIITSMCFEWLNKSILRFFEKYKQNQCLPKFISTVTYSLIGIVIIVLVLWYLGVNFFRNHLDSDLVILLNIGGLVILTQAGYTLVLSLRQVAQESSKYAIRSILNAIVKLTIAICFLCFFRIGPKGILLGMVISAGSIFIWDIFSLYHKYQVKACCFSKKLLKNLLAYGLPLIGLSVGSYILAAADRYMIEYFLTTDDVGIYSAGYNLSSTIIQLPIVILLLAAYPVIVETFEKEKEKETILLLNKIIAIYFIFLVPIIFGIAVLSKNITAILLGKGFQRSYIILPWISIGVFCFGLIQYLYKPFELKQKTKILSLLAICAAVINIVLNLFFIPKFGTLGAAYTTLISYVTYLFSTWFLSRKIFAWSFPWQTIVRTFLASTGMYLILHFIVSIHPVSKVFLIIDILIGIACYFSTLLILKEKITIQGFRYAFQLLKARK